MEGRFTTVFERVTYNGKATDLKLPQTNSGQSAFNHAVRLLHAAAFTVFGLQIRVSGSPDYRLRSDGRQIFGVVTARAVPQVFRLALIFRRR